MFGLADFMSAQSVSPEVLSSNGGSAQTSSIQLDWTIGEIAIETLNTSAGIYTEGFHQPAVIVEFIPDSYDPKGTSGITMFNGIRVTPNPASTFLNVHFTMEHAPRIHYQLMSADGTPVKKGDGFAKEGDMHIELSGLPAGIYVLRFHDDPGTFFPVYKISKIQ